MQVECDSPGGMKPASLATIIKKKKNGKKNSIFRATLTLTDQTNISPQASIVQLKITYKVLQSKNTYKYIIVEKYI